MDDLVELKLCPFCGRKPRVELAKKTNCQLHGEPSQAVTVYCHAAKCPARPSVSAGDVFNGGEAKARTEAIAAWNRRADAAELTRLRQRETALQEMAAACHRAKWEFEETPAFDVLHRIGDMARAALTKEPSAGRSLLKENPNG